MDEDLYETDFYTWTQRQAEHLRAGRVGHADLANIAEEIESLGKSQAATLRSAYRLIAMHLLKMMVQPARATKSRRSTITRERLDIEEYLADGPGLKPRRAELFGQAHAAARREAAAETRLQLGRFPVDPPFTVDEVEAEDFWPAQLP
jgi:hypothetical protein